MVLPSKPTKRIRGSQILATMISIVLLVLLILLLLAILQRLLFSPDDVQFSPPPHQKSALGLPLWKGLQADEKLATIGNIVPTGAYQYQETPYCQTLYCSVYFPLADLSDLMTEELGVQDPGIMDAQWPQNKPFIRTTKYPPPHFLSNHSDAGYHNIHNVDSSDTDFALLTRRGFKGDSVNQDRIMLLDAPSSGMKLMALFDGHGDKGHLVAHAAMMKVPHLLSLPKGTARTMSPNALVHTIKKLDESIPTAVGSGATSIVMVQQKTQLLISNLGDSFGLVVEYANGKATILYQTKPHKPHVIQERERIERAGGRVLLPQAPGDTSRVLIPMEGMEMALAMSRSLGDIEGKKLGVLTALPTVDVIPLEANKNVFAVAATDGLLDYLDVQDVAQHLGRVIYGATSTVRLVDACEQLILRASQEWKQRSMGQYRDDISILVTKL